MVSRRATLRWWLLGLSIGLSGCSGQLDGTSTPSETVSEVPPSPSAKSCVPLNSTESSEQTGPSSTGSATGTVRTDSAGSRQTGTPHPTNTETRLEVWNFDSESHTAWITVNEGDERIFESWVSLCPNENLVLLDALPTTAYTIHTRVTNGGELQTTWDVSSKGQIGSIGIQRNGAVRFDAYYLE